MQKRYPYFSAVIDEVMWIVKKLFLLSGASALEKTKTLFCLLMMSCMVRTLGARKVNPYSVLSQGILATMEHLPPGTNWSRQSRLSHTNVWTIYWTFGSSLFRLGFFGQNCLSTVWTISKLKHRKVFEEAAIFSWSSSYFKSDVKSRKC